MALGIAFTGRPSLRRRWTATLAVTGFSLLDDPEANRFWIGIKSAAGTPAKPSDLDGYHTWFKAHRITNGAQLVQNVAPDGTARLTLTIQIDPSFFEAAIATDRFWAGFSEGEDESDDFLAVDGPRMAR